jgi:large subunit ribosomal protein L10
MERKKSKAFLGKEKIVAEIEKNFRAAKSAIFVDYKGITVGEVTALRAKFRKSGVAYKIYKNNLVRIALKNMGVTGLDDKLNGTLAVCFSNRDEITAVKILHDAKFDKKMAIKFGVIGTSILPESDCQKLATMPSKEILVAQILSAILAGARNLASVIHALPRQMAVVINERAKQLGSEKHLGTGV